jgi:hypothetical protein
MGFVVRNIKGILIVSGLLTCTMLYPVLAPQAALQGMFGETLEGPVAGIVVRNWGALIALVGVLLLYAAYVPSARPTVLFLAAAGKLIFIGLVLGHGARYLGHQAGVAVFCDLVMSILFVVYLMAPAERR